MSPPPFATKVGHGLAKVLGIKLNYRNETGSDPVLRGESVFSVSSANAYLEREPTAWEWISEVVPTPKELLSYLYSLFPFVHWISRYNTQWLIGDLIAGITIGAVVVPQGMAYALLANLPTQFGLYTSFMGVLLYWFFATSKDITIGPVAVLSTVTGNVVSIAVAALPEYKDSPQVIASALAIVSGAIVCFIGLVRCGWIVDFISLAAISAFMTGSALNIAVGQVPALMGITGFSSRDSTYLVVIHILQHLNATKLDAAMGLTALTMLYLIRSTCNFAARKMPRHRKIFFFLNTLRTVFVILLYTMISWLVNKDVPNVHANSKLARFTILGNVPRGFQYAVVPTVNARIIGSFASQLPATVIVLIIEHIAIAKSFGRVNNYTINPSQEFVAIGVTNLLAPFLGAYPATGSFSRTAIKAKAGVRTPFAGVITAAVVLLAIYALPAVFFYISNAVLAAVIIHAVGDLITPPNTVYQFWLISPLEVLVFFAGVIVTIFSSIEDGIYVTITVSVAILLFRVFKAQGRFLGRVKIHSVVGDHLIDNDGKTQRLARETPNPGTNAMRNVFLPIEHGDGSNPEIAVERPYPGVFIYRFSEGYNYPNANHYLDHMVRYIFENTRRTNPQAFSRLGDRPWNDPGPRRGRVEPDRSHLPVLKAIILDFSSVNNVDITSVQHLIDVRNQLDRYASPGCVDWHLACINNRWTKRALASAGFGYPTPGPEYVGEFRRWKPIFSVAEIGGSSSAAADAEARENRIELRRHATQDAESGKRGGDEIASDSASMGSETFEGGLTASKAYGEPRARIAVVQGLNRPLFHVDLTSALHSAIANIEGRHDQTEKTERAGDTMG